MSFYPRSAVEQLALVAKLARIDRRFDQRRILVAWHEGWVEPRMLRDALVRLLDGASAQMRQMAAGPADKLDATERLARAMIEAPGRSSIARLMRSRLGRENMDMFAYGLAAVGLGITEKVSWENHDSNSQEPTLISLLDRAFGLDRARGPGHGSPVDTRTAQIDPEAAQLVARLFGAVAGDDRLIGAP